MGTETDSTTYKGHEISIQYDESPENPRTEWDNFTVIHCCSSRYYLGEENHADWDECREAIAKAKKQGDLVFKVYAYIHSGTRLSLEDFYGKLPQGHAEFDSGQSGFIVVKKKEIIANWGKKNWTEKLRKKAYDIAKGDIETFNSYLNGEVYGFMIDDGDGDSCWGYYAVEDAMSEAKSSVDFMVKKDMKAHFDQLKTWIKNKVPFQYRTTFAYTMEPVT